MTTFFFARSVPLLVGVEADTEHEAWKLAGYRVDDFMSDANEMIPKESHDDGKPYFLEYQGDAIYLQRMQELQRKVNGN